MRLLAILTCLLWLCGCPDSAGNDSTGDSGPGQAQEPADTVQSATGDEAPEDGTAPADPGLAGTMMRGTVNAAGEGMTFTPCNSQIMLQLLDDDAGTLSSLFAEAEVASEGLYVQMLATAGEDGLSLSRLLRASPVMETMGCNEDLSGLLYLARGNEPFWGVEVRSSGVIALLRPSQTEAAVDELLFDISDSDIEEDSALFRASGRDGNPGIEVSLVPGPCRDSMSGDWFAMKAVVSFDGSELHGCAWPGEGEANPEGE